MIVQNKDAIGTAIKEHVKDGSADELVNRFHALIPSRQSAINNHSHGLEPCSTMLVSVYHILNMVMLMKGNDRIPGPFRGVLDLMGTVKNRVFQERVVEMNSGFLDIEGERLRLFNRNASIPEQGFRACVLCNHQYVDFPDSNKGIAERNKRKFEDHENAKTVFEQQKQQLPESEMKNKVSICSLFQFSFPP